MQLTVSAEEMRRRSVFIGVPMYGGKCDYAFASGLSNTVTELAMRGIVCKTFILSNESLIPRARNYIADEFMRSGMSHLLFIDADIGFNSNDVMTLLAVADPVSDYDIVCGGYPKKVISWSKIKTAVNAGMADNNADDLADYVGDFVFSLTSDAQQVDLNEPFKVLESGTGFMMIQRKVFERYADKYPVYQYKPDHARSEHFDGSRKIMNYFHCDIDFGVTDQEIFDAIGKAARGEPDAKEAAENVLKVAASSSLRYLSEDYFFCQRARDSGSNVWLLPWLKLSHVGMHVYGGSIEKMAQLKMAVGTDVQNIKKGGDKI
jgi:hypothetical protein